MPRERLLYGGPGGAVGVFRASPDDPGNGQPFVNPLIVVPRTTLRLNVERTGETKVVGPGSAVVYACNDVSHVEWIDPIDRCDFICPSPAAYEECFARAWDQPIAGSAFLGATPGLAVHMRKLVGSLLSTDAPADPLSTEERVWTMVNEVAATLRPTRRAATAADHRLADRVHMALSEDPLAVHSLADLAGQVGASVGHMCRAFRRATGGTIHQQRTVVRLLRSFEELDDDLSAVAHRWGFASHSHYSAVFRQWFGVAPRAASKRYGVQPPMSNGPWWRVAKTSVVPFAPTSGSIR